jgi:hypothetical protein
MELYSAYLKMILKHGLSHNSSFWFEGNPEYSLSIVDLGKNLNDMASIYRKKSWLLKLVAKILRCKTLTIC